MDKTKILDYLAYELIALLLLVAVQITGLIWFQPPAFANNQPAQSGSAAQPKILGAATDIRGEPAVPSTIQQTGLADTAGVKAKSFLVFGLDSGQILLERNGQQQLKIASLTKLMTALVAYQNLDLNKAFDITSADTLDVSPDLGLKPGDDVNALDVFNAMLIGSNNDAALALADFTARATGENFVGLMNAQAQTLGMVHSNFANPMGFDSPENYSTAEDLKILITTAEHLSAFSGLGREMNYKFVSNNGITYQTTTTNKLLQLYPDIEAIKTGYTAQALGAMATKFDLGGHQIVVLVLDSPDREADTLALKQEVSNNFQ